MKHCKCCGKTKELTDFGKKSINIDGIRYTCKECESIDKLNRRRTKRGKLKSIYDNQIKNSKHRKYELPNYTSKEFLDRFINDSIYLSHYNKWVDTNYAKDYAPSFDRLDDYKPYSFDNLQIMYWFENNKKGLEDRINGINKKKLKPIIGVHKKTSNVIEFESIKEASINGFSKGSISQCCNGKIMSSGGYVWRFKK